MKDLSLSRTISGVGIIAVGVLALLGAFNVINFSDLFSTYWPLIPIAIGLILLLSNWRENYIWSLVLILLGTVWQLESLAIVEVNVWQIFWPLVLVALGWSVLAQKSGPKPGKNTANSTAILGGSEIKNSSRDYKGGKLTAILGGSSVDLRKATIKKEATIEILAVMGGMEISVPEGWVVHSSVLPLLGGVENSTTAPKGSKAPVLNITGTALLGGVEIKH